MHSEIGTSAGARALSIAKERALLITSDASDFIFTVEAGLISVEVRPENDRRRIFDFLVAGDVLSSGTLAAGQDVRLRALQAASILRQPKDAWIKACAPGEAVEHIERSALRSHLAGLISGLADVDARVASFLAVQFMRFGGTAASGQGREIPLAREDVADYILVNPDTLSRAYSRFRDLGLIGRSGASRPVVLDFEGLLARTPIAQLLVASCRGAPPHR